LQIERVDARRGVKQEVFAILQAVLDVSPEEEQNLFKSWEEQIQQAPELFEFALFAIDGLDLAEAAHVRELIKAALQAAPPPVAEPASA
jgi:hypothetical protein